MWCSRQWNGLPEAVSLTVAVSFSIDSLLLMQWHGGRHRKQQWPCSEGAGEEGLPQCEGIPELEVSWWGPSVALGWWPGNLVRQQGPGPGTGIHMVHVRADLGAWPRQNCVPGPERSGSWREDGRQGKEERQVTGINDVNASGTWQDWPYLMLGRGESHRVRLLAVNVMHSYLVCCLSFPRLALPLLFPWCCLNCRWFWEASSRMWLWIKMYRESVCAKYRHNCARQLLLQHGCLRCSWMWT